MLKLKLQHFGYLMGRADSLEKTLMLGKVEETRGEGVTEDEMVGWHHWFNGHEFWASSRSWWWTEKPGMLQSMGSQRVRHDWTELNMWWVFRKLGWDGGCQSICAYRDILFRILVKTVWKSYSFWFTRNFNVKSNQMFDFSVLGWPKCSFGFFHNIMQKIPNEPLTNPI